MSGSGACRDDWDRGFDKDGDYERPSQPAEDERVKDADSLLQRLVETPAGERIRMKCGAADLRSVITDLLSLLPVQPAQLAESDSYICRNCGACFQLDSDTCPYCDDLHVERVLYRPLTDAVQPAAANITDLLPSTPEGQICECRCHGYHEVRAATCIHCQSAASTEAQDEK